MKLLIIAIGTAAAALTAAACSWAPYNGQQYEHTTDTIQFKGCSVLPDSQITVETDDLSSPPGSSGFGGTQQVPPTIAHIAVSPSVPTGTDAHGVKWYCWSGSMVLPSGAWLGLATGGGPPVPTIWTATLRVLDNGKPVYTYKNDPSQCPNPLGTDQITGSAPCATAAGRVRISASHL